MNWVGTELRPGVAEIGGVGEQGQGDTEMPQAVDRVLAKLIYIQPLRARKPSSGNLSDMFLTSVYNLSVYIF